MNRKLILILGLFSVGVVSGINTQKQGSPARANSSAEDSLSKVGRRDTQRNQVGLSEKPTVQQQDAGRDVVHQFYAAYITEWIREKGPDGDKREAIQK